MNRYLRCSPAFLLLLSSLYVVVPCSPAQAQLFSVASQAELTTGTYDSFPRWSPDGSRILFSRGRDYTNSDDGLSLYRMNSDGSAVTLLMLANDMVNLIPAAWEPSGMRILCFFDRVLDNRVIAMKAADGSEQCTLIPADARMPDLSWDGGTLAYSAGTYYGVKTGLRMDANGCTVTNPATIVTSAPSILRFSPDGQKVAFATPGPEGKSLVAVVNRDGSGLSVLAEGNEDYTAPSWRATGTHVACLSNRDQMIASQYDIWIINMSDKQMQRLTYTGDYGSIDWSRDGSKLVASRQDSTGHNAIYVLNVIMATSVSDWNQYY